MTTSARARWLATITLLAIAGRAGAQQRIPRYGEFRLDGIFADGAAVHAGAGAVVPLGVYTRLSVGAAGGVSWRSEAANGSGRVDALARFLLDPFREAPIGLSLGGGLTVPYTSGDRTVRPYMTAVIDLEGRMRGRLTPAFQLGLGGGTRVGFVVRTSPRGWR